MKITSGNAELDGMLTRQWIVGQFMPKGKLQHSNDVEIKWGIHQAGDRKEEWVTGEIRTSIAILISGKVKMEFRDQTVLLDKSGDYVMWGVGADHRWRCLEPSTIITIRWISKAQIH